MAKKTSGASEINGFIAVVNEQPKAVSRTAAVKKSSNSTSSSTKSSSTGKDAKAGKPGASTTKKVAELENKKTEPKKSLKPQSVSKPEPPKNVRGNAPSKNATQTNPTGVATTGVKKATSKTLAAASSTKAGPPKAQPKGANTGVKPKTDSVKNETSSKTKAPTKTVAGKTPARTTTKPGQTSSRPAGPKQHNTALVAAKPTGTNKPNSKVSSKIVNKKEPPHKIPDQPATNKVTSKTGLSFDITLEPAKAPKPSALPSEGTKASVDGSKPSAPPPLVKQRTFVKDEEDDNLKSSLPHIVAPDEPEGTKDDVGEYDDDFEEYESDFEEDESEAQQSVSEAVPRKIPNSATQAVTLTKTQETTEPATSSISQPSTENPSLSRKNSGETEPAGFDGGEYNYEDDFEDYSSDFEDDTESGFTSSNDTTSDSSLTTDSSESEVVADKASSKGKVVEEERKLDSGNYDLKTTIARSDVIKQSQLNYIKEAISRENTMFKDGMATEKSPSPPPLQIMDFKAASERDDVTVRKRLKLGWSRGKTILSMLKLHEMDFHIFEMKPMNYEEFIKLRGHSNRAQQEVQTKDDDIWEETQTDDIDTEDKWTQSPISYHSWAGKYVDWSIYLEDKRGFGTSNPPSLDRKQFFASNYNAKRLQKFVTNAAQVMAVLLEEEAYGFKNTLALQQTESNFGFSDGYVAIYCEDIDFLKDRKVTHVCFSPHFSNVVATCYERSIQPEEYLPVELTCRWLICLWDMIAVSQPMKILVASAPVESITFDCLYPDLFYAGLSDGTVCLWDLSEPDSDHDYCRRANFDSILRTPTYCTFSSGVDTTDIHVSAVKWLRSVSSGRTKVEDVVTPTTLFSLSEDGKLIVWTVVRLPENLIHRQKMDVRSSPSGRVRLALTSVHHPINVCPKDLKSHVDFLCMEVKQKSVFSILLGTNFGFVCQYPLVKFKNVVSRFGIRNDALLITAIELCPIDHRIILVGVSDGTLRIHTEVASQPLKTIAVSNIMANGIACIRWSSFKAGLIVTLDQDSNLLVWNLCKSDQHPVVKMSYKAPTKHGTDPQKTNPKSEFFARGFRDKYGIQGMDISRDVRLPYLGIVVSDSTVHVHRFTDEFATKGAQVKNEEAAILRTYFDLLHK